MINLKFTRKEFKFKEICQTSRGILKEKHSWFIEVWETKNPEIKGIGECSIIPGLSPDFESHEKYEKKLQDLCDDINVNLDLWPSIKFGFETAILDLKNGGEKIIFKNSFINGNKKIPINGLVWMGDYKYMEKQIEEKLEQGFSTIKMKIGAINFNDEIKLLSQIREKYSRKQISLRVDANGAFTAEEALVKIDELSKFDIHSIEQPIMAGQINEMKKLCKKTKIPIALDEELIGIYKYDCKVKLIKEILPQFLILKPSLHGGISGTKEWIKIAEKFNLNWWITSALESNIGLNAICQLSAEYENPLPQGLGTGSIYINNIPPNLKVKNGYIFI